MHSWRSPRARGGVRTRVYLSLFCLCVPPPLGVFVSLCNALRSHSAHRGGFTRRLVGPPQTLTRLNVVAVRMSHKVRISGPDDEPGNFMDEAELNQCLPSGRWTRRHLQQPRVIFWEAWRSCRTCRTARRVHKASAMARPDHVLRRSCREGQDHLLLRPSRFCR